jgi:acetyltransferase-like isoleucine patch superfamily enzyme
MSKLFDPGFYTEVDLKDAGFKAIGENVLIEKNCTIVGIENISIGNNVRIDGFNNIIAAGNGYLSIGSYVHIGSFCHLVAAGGIIIHNFVGISQRVSIYSVSDDYTGEYLTNPTVSAKYKRVEHGEVVIGKHAIIGSGSVILPGVTIGEGVSVGALSLVNNNLEGWNIYTGCPAKRLIRKSKNLLKLTDQFLNEENNKTNT